MPFIDPNFRADNQRSISVFGDINEEMVSRIAPGILHLRSLGDAPITVYINSRGGQVRCAEYIYGLLHSKTAGGRQPRIITVAIGNAASAAATLLTLGDYAITYPKAAIHFHGVRYGEVADVTMESASTMASQLESTNRATASMLAEAGTKRLAFHYARLKNDFEQIRNKLKITTDIECFAISLKQKTSPNGDCIIEKALQRWQSLLELSPIVNEVNGAGKQGLDFETEVLQSVIKHEVQKNKNNGWKLDDSGLFQICSDYLLLRDYHIGKHVQLIKTLFEVYSNAFLTEEELEQFKIPNNPTAQAIAKGRIEQIIKPFCYFTASIWHALQEDENPLSPSDAYWLGAVDEIYDSTLPSLRDIAESQDPQQPNLPVSSEPPLPS